MDAITKLPANIPPHDAVALHAIPSHVVAEWPPGTFVENIALLDDGTFAVSILSDARVDRVMVDGTVSVLHRFDAPPTGLAVMDGWLYVATGAPGGLAHMLWRINCATGDAEQWVPLPQLQFPNGVTPFAPGTLLIAESWLGQLWQVNLAKQTLSLWLADERLTRAPGIDLLPGANGVKRFGNEVTVSSNGRALLLRVNVNRDGSPGPLRILTERLQADDFAYDTAGNLYLATHLGHSLDRLDRDGARVSLGGPTQGFAGSTACAFDGDGSLFVTTTGGILDPPDGILQPARLLRVDTGALGHDLAQSWRE